MKLLNIGCGINISSNKSWENIDNSYLAKLRLTPAWIFIKILIKFGVLDKQYLDYPKLKIVDISKKLPYKDNSIDFIYCSQVIEHIELHKLKLFLYECLRVLKKEGVMRILTPDLDKIIFLYQHNEIELFKLNDNLNSEIGSDHFNLFFYPRSMVLDEKRTILKKLLDFIPEQHKYIFNFSKLKILLNEVGFNNIFRVDTLDSNFPNVKELDRYQETSIMIEVRK